MVTAAVVLTKAVLFLFQSIMEQFNPCLRNFVAMGKTYEKALSSEYISGLFFISLAVNEPAIQALVSLVCFIF